MKPAPAEHLYLYLAASSLAVEAVLVREVGGKQHPIYYVSHVLRDAETRYPNIEKFAFALITASRKLRQYFQGRLVIVYTDQPLKKIMGKPKVIGRLAAWTMELSQFFVEYHPRTAIKGHVLADFVVECSFSEANEVVAEAEESDSIVAVLQQKQSPWTLYADGSSTTDVSGAGIILTSPEGFKVQQAIRFQFKATNNEAEYEAVLAGLRLAKSLEVQRIVIFSDSQLVVKQVSEEYEVRGHRMIKYLEELKERLQYFQFYEFQGVERNDNFIADALSKLATTDVNVFSGSVYLEILQHPSVHHELVMCADRTNCWLTPYLEYLADGVLPSDQMLAKKIKYKSANFVLIDGDLF